MSNPIKITPGETIVAISTPVAAGGIGMIRISGENARLVADKVFRATGKTISETGGYCGLHGRLLDEAGEFDEAVAFVYISPKSYTGEDVVELCCHGGVYLVRRALRACIAVGARPAMAGEFTRRALQNGKMSLTQAEAVADLICAQGEHSAKAALRALDGAVSRRISLVNKQLLQVSSALAAWVDYPDEDIEEVSDANLRTSVDEITSSLQALLKEYDSGKIFREGVDTVIVGRPNVGKSTLMNLLSGSAKSIVTSFPGTTRDVVEDSIRLGDIVLNLADTAGLRETSDPVERIGVELAEQRLISSTLVLAVFDSSDALAAEDFALMEKVKNRPAIAVINKSDLARKIDLEAVAAFFPKVVEISAGQGSGLAALEAAVTEVLDCAGLDSSAGILINERQRLCAVEALSSMEDARSALLSGETLDAVSVCIDFAIDSLLSLTGERASTAVIDEVFSRFCVGK